MMPAMVNPTWADILSAVSTAASALLTLGLVVLALVAWRTASDALEESRKASLAAQKSAAAAEAANEQLRRDSAEQTRPYVFAEVLPGLAGSPTWDIKFDMNTHGSGLWPIPEDGPEASGLSADNGKFYLVAQALTRRVGELGR